MSEAAGADDCGRHELKLSQQELAAMINVSTVTLGKALQVAQSEGLIALRYNRIAILDTAKAWVTRGVTSSWVARPARPA